jgi:phosphonate transport system substrate-binding protein
MRNTVIAACGLTIALGWRPSVLWAQSEPQASSVGQTTLTIARVSDDPKRHYAKFKPFIDYLARQLAPMGIEEGRVVFMKNNQELIQALKRGEVDLVSETVFSTLAYEEAAGAKILLRRWKKGSSQYRSVIFVRKDSGLNTLEDLKGKTLAVEDPGSTSSYLLPAAILKQRGMKLVSLASFKEKPGPDEVGYAFSGGEASLAHWVYRGLADAGAVSNEEFQDAGDMPQEFLPHFQVIFESPPVPRNLISVRPGLDARLEKAITDALLKMPWTEEGPRVMKSFDNTGNFDTLLGGAQEALSEIRVLYPLLRDELLGDL